MKRREPSYLLFTLKINHIKLMSDENKNLREKIADFTRVATDLCLELFLPYRKNKNNETENENDDMGTSEAGPES